MSNLCWIGCTPKTRCTFKNMRWWWWWWWWFSDDFSDYLDRSILRPSSIHPPFERPTAPQDAAGPATDASQVLEWPLGLWPTCSLVHSVATKNLSPQQKIADNPRYDWDIPFFLGWEMIGICDGFVRTMAAIDANIMRSCKGLPLNLKFWRCCLDEFLFQGERRPTISKWKE